MTGRAKVVRQETSMTAVDWWRGATIYQIYPRSFLDTNGDGIGDLPGVAKGLDYVASLGVEAIWVSPFFRSPMADFGYDIADYRAVDPVFGTLEDFDRLLHKAHGLGLKLIIDQVLSHTSAEHAWFEQSRQSRSNPKSDWYVWADPRADGGPPNNWLSIFGGAAWQWEPRRAQYYLHNFLAAQPDLNFHNPQVRQAMLDNVRFWLERGVDGVRLDAINFCFHDPLLRDNPPKSQQLRTSRGFSADNPYAYQSHLYDNTQPENLDFLAELRALLDRYPGTVALGEISSEDSSATMAEYTGPGRLHMAYSFELLGPDRSPAHIRATVENLEDKMSAGWPCWALSNHDVERVVSRWGSSDSPRHLATQLTALVCSLRGSVCIFQGEELGLSQADVPFHVLQDPYGIAFWPNFKGRDGCRTPMPWSSATHAGFSDGDPWLPVSPEHLPLAVEQQERDANSTLHGFRRFIRWRRALAPLQRGDIEFTVSTESVLAFKRRLAGEVILAAFNLSDQPQSLELSGADAATVLSGHGMPEGQLHGTRLSLPPHGVLFARLP
jgi:alpha-glucosidase